MTNPLQDGYTLPFEGNLHDGTIILLPYRFDTWEDGGLKAFSEFKEIILTIALYEHVYVIKSKNVKYDISSLYNKENVSIHEIEYDDSWARDNTLIFLRNNEGKLRAVDFGFNAWGGLVDGLYLSSSAIMLSIVSVFISLLNTTIRFFVLAYVASVLNIRMKLVLLL